jgi:hypothetical protein
MRNGRRAASIAPSTARGACAPALRDVTLVVPDTDVVPRSIGGRTGRFLWTAPTGCWSASERGGAAGRRGRRPRRPRRAPAAAAERRAPPTTAGRGSPARPTSWTASARAAEDRRAAARHPRRRRLGRRDPPSASSRRTRPRVRPAGVAGLITSSNRRAGDDRVTVRPQRTRDAEHRPCWGGERRTPRQRDDRASPKRARASPLPDGDDARRREVSDRRRCRTVTSMGTAPDERAVGHRSRRTRPFAERRNALARTASADRATRAYSAMTVLPPADDGTLGDAEKRQYQGTVSACAPHRHAGPTAMIDCVGELARERAGSCQRRATGSAQADVVDDTPNFRDDRSAALRPARSGSTTSRGRRTAAHDAVGVVGTRCRDRARGRPGTRHHDRSSRPATTRRGQEQRRTVRIRRRVAAGRSPCPAGEAVVHRVQAAGEAARHRSRRQLKA